MHTKTNVLFFTVLLSCFLFSLHGKELIGTKSYKEIEIRTAYDPNTSINYEEIERSLSEYAKAGHFNFPRQFKGQFVLKKEKEKIYYDQYLDSDQKIDLANSSLRIRKRLRSFKSKEDFSRCEIQLKYNYDFSKYPLVEVNEMRFELRKESDPFNRGVALLEDSCTDRILYQTINTGKYSNLPLKISRKIQEMVPSLKLSNLSLIKEVFTKRYRYHLNTKSPWGKGPNPDQVILMTIDEVYGSKGKHLFTEVEIERDRSTFNKLSKKTKKKSLLRKIAEDNRKIAMDNLKNDFYKVKEIVSKSIYGKPLAPMTKVRRLR